MAPSERDERRPLLSGTAPDPHPSNHNATSDTPLQTPDETTPSWTLSDTLKVAAVMYCFFYLGLIVSAFGALLESIETYYRISDSTASFAVPINLIGYIAAAASLSNVVSTSGWRGVAVISPVMRLLAVIIVGIGGPLPVMFIGFMFAGFGGGLCDAGFNSWATGLNYVNVVQGFLHSAYAAGAIAGPVATLVVTNRGLPWYWFYRAMIASSLLEILVLAFAFRKDMARKAEVEEDLSDEHEHPKGLIVKLVVCCSIFYFVYIGIETSFTTWVVLFMKRVRHASQTSAALSSSTFWIGMVVGRASLGPVTEYFGISTAVTTYILGTIISQILFIFIHRTSAALAFLTINGLFMAPMFPSAIVVLGKRLSMPETIRAVSVATSAGQVGGALAPLAIGFMADRFGLEYLPHIILGLLLALLVLWRVFVKVG